MGEKSHIDVADIESHYDELEKAMLAEFFEYAKEHKTYFWIHWNIWTIVSMFLGALIGEFVGNTL